MRIPTHALYRTTLMLTTLCLTYYVHPMLALILSLIMITKLSLAMQETQAQLKEVQTQQNTSDDKPKEDVQKENKRKEKYHLDSLTSLPNKNALIEDLDQMKPATLILINIDAFKDINDFYGLTAGDSLIKQVAKRLSSIPTIPPHALYHFYVDKFALLIHQELSDQEIQNCVKEIENFLQKHTFYASMNQNILFTLSFGISATEDKENNNQALIPQATLALSATKTHSHNWVIYKPSLKQKNHYEDNIYWVKKLKLAIQEERIEPYFQPIVNQKTNKIISHEALMRLVEKNGVAIAPYLFLDISKKAKLYTTLTAIMIEKTFATFQDTNSHFSINFSYEDMQDSEILELLSKKLSKGNIGKRFTAEILESESIGNYDIVKNFINTIKTYGAKVAIDDFGSGYSNFERLFNLDIDFIKIDGSIIKDIDENKQLKIIVETIVSFAKKSNIKVIAEHTHSQEIVDILKDMGIKRMQGYYFAKPNAVPVKSIEKEESLVE